MRSSDCDIVIVPGYTNSGPDHWQSRWQRKLSSARRVEQDDWDRPVRDLWTTRLVEAIRRCRRPVVIVAHSLGVISVAHAAPSLPKDAVRGAFLVAPADTEASTLPEAIDPAFAPVPQDPLPFPSLLVASRSDPYCAYERAEDLAYAWGSALLDAGDAGHINAESGFGPWPEGLMRFAGFLKRL
jgi:predicted alpha/beta hydrolase family esterase